MANGSIITDSGKKIILNRSYSSSPDYTVVSRFKVGISNDTPNIADTDLDVAIPITDGTVNDDGDNQLTGSDGGDNTTDNAVTYKPGAGVTDNKAQNLIANGTDATKTWTIANLAALGTVMTATEPFSLWVYIKDATAYAKLLSAGTALQIRFRTNGDAANLSYLYSRTAAQLSTGWNLVTSGTTAVNGLTEGAGGPPSGALNEFVIEMTTNNATDTFVAGDTIYDLLRQWAESDLFKNFVTGYPNITEASLNVEYRGFLTTTEANGYDLNGLGIFNTDGTAKMHSEDTHTAISKSNTEQITYIIKDRII